MLSRLWHSFQEPRIKKSIMACAYVCAILVGIHTVLDPPSSIEGVLGAVLTITWGLCYLVGGLLGVGSVMPGWWFSERWGLFSIMIGVLIYLGIIAYLHHTNDLGNRMPQYWAIMLSLPLLGNRLHDIWKLPYEPRRR